MKQSACIARVTMAVAVAVLANVVTATASSTGDSATAVCSDSGWSGPPELTVHIVDRVGLAESVRAEMLREASHPWVAAGMRVRWAAGAAVTGAHSAANQVYVVLANQPEEDAATASATRRALASTTFVDGKPTSQIRVHVSEVDRLLAGCRFSDRTLIDRPRRLRERLMGRVLGRAVAHELGHVLFASMDHASSGLMRAFHKIEILAAPSRQPFQIVWPTSLCDAPRAGQ